MSLNLTDSSERGVEAHAPHAEKHESHKALFFFLFALIAYSGLPVLGVGVYRNGSGDRFFSLWYMLGFLLLAFFLMHEFITPVPPKDAK